MICSLAFPQAAIAAVQHSTTLLHTAVSNVAWQTIKHVFQFPHKHVMGVILLSAVTCAILLGLIFAVKLLSDKFFPLPAHPLSR
jgi:hypothetical protein